MIELKSISVMVSCESGELIQCHSDLVDLSLWWTRARNFFWSSIGGLKIRVLQAVSIVYVPTVDPPALASICSLIKWMWRLLYWWLNVIEQWTKNVDFKPLSSLLTVILWMDVLWLVYSCTTKPNTAVYLWNRVVWAKGMYNNLRAEALKVFSGFCPF